MWVVFRGGLGNQLLSLAAAISYHLRRDPLWNGQISAVKSWYRGGQRGPAFAEHTREFELGRIAGLSSLLEHPPRVVEDVVYRAYQLAVRCPARLPLTSTGPDQSCLDTKRAVLLYEGLCFDYEALRPAIQRMRDRVWAPIHGAGVRPEGRTKSHTVCVHVRRGDSLLPFNFSGGVPSPDYYIRGVQAVSRPDSAVVVFSDDVNWCREVFALQPWTIVNEPDVARALGLMVRADAFVLSSSTLGWWAALLSAAGGSSVVAPRPFMPGWAYAADERLVPDGWRRLDPDFGWY